MTQSRNNPCDCGSGLKYKKCCGSAITKTNAPELAASNNYNSSSKTRTSSNLNTGEFERRISKLLNKGNFALAEILLYKALNILPDYTKAHHILGQIYATQHIHALSMRHFYSAMKLAPNWSAAKNNYNRARQEFLQSTTKTHEDSQTNQFMLIKAWGFGFWSDVGHVLINLLLCEITGRTPVTHWGQNSYFSNDPDKDAFRNFFEPVSAYSITDLQTQGLNYFPPKWVASNIDRSELNKENGPHSRMSGLYLLERSENVVVSDYYTDILSVINWLPSSHPIYNLHPDDAMRYLIRRYLKPNREMLSLVDDFYQEHLADLNFISVHARGSDKITEVSSIDEVNAQYYTHVDNYLQKFECDKIFLMSDDVRIIQNYINRYGDKIITTNCLRTDNEEGLLNRKAPCPKKLGQEVLLDTLLAAKSKALVGNASSNVSVFAYYLKDDNPESTTLLGHNYYQNYNTCIYDW